MRRMFLGSPAKDAKASEAKDKRRVRDNLFSPSASSSSSVEAEDAPDGDDRGGDSKAPLFPTRSASMMAANPRSRSANANSKKQFPEVRRRTMFPASASFTLGSTSTTPASTSTAEPNENLGGSAVLPERRGLFEADDDAESIESFQERAKLRQTKKKSEMDAIRGQLEAAQQRIDQLESQVVRESKEKEECEIRMKECQRIIEKRNKQLMKASERMARFTEQSEIQVAELQAKVAALNAENSQLRVDSAENLDMARSEAEQRFVKLQSDFDAKWKQHERHLQGRADRAVEIAEQSVQAKLAENIALRRKIQELEGELEAAIAEASAAKAGAEAAAAAAAENLLPSRIKQTEEYQALLKQFENAEAISRGLRYQLDKEREEKKYLKQQLGALQTSGANIAGFFDTNAAAAGSANIPSPASSAASAADLSSFDFTAPTTTVTTQNGSTPPSPANARERSRSQNRSRSSSSGLFSSSPFGIGKPSDDAGDSKENAAPDQEPTRKKRGSSVNALQTPLETFTQEIAEDKATTSPAPGGLKTASSSVNFFEKFSIKFKRSSSPRSSATSGNSQDTTPVVSQPTVNTSAAAPAPAASASSVVSPLPRAAVSGRGKVLKERPRMYVARSPSHHEDESSDSIFGSESDSSSSFDSEDEAPPPPPPPLAQDIPLSRSADKPAVAPSPPPLFSAVDGGADADSSDSDDSDDSSSSDESAIEIARRAPLDPPAPIPIANVAGVATRSPPIPTAKTAAQVSSKSSSSDLSDDSSSDEDNAASVEKPSPFSSPAQPAHRQPSRSKSDRSEPSSSSSSSASDDEGRRLSAKNRSRGRTEEKDTTSKKRDKRSMSLPRSPDASTHHHSHADGRHKSVVKNRMNEYMEARTKKRNDKLKKKEEKEHAEHKKKEEYEKEWEKMAQEERERKRKQQQARRTGRRRPASMKTVRVSQMRQQMTKQQMQKDTPVHFEQRPRGDTMEEGRSRRHSQRQNESKTSGSEDEGDGGNEEETKPVPTVLQPTESPPLPPEPTEADTELYLRQQARLRERHEMEMKRKQEAEEADQVRGQIHRKVEMWAFGKELLHMILTLDQISTSDALKNCQLMVVQSPDNETVRKAYRSIIRVIHPDKLRNASVPEQLEAKELFTVLNQAFERFKTQAAGS